MATYVVTGATGFLGAELTKRLLAREDAVVHALVRAGSQGRLATKLRTWPGADRVHAVIGDLTLPGLGIDPADVERLQGTVDHLVHLAAALRHHDR